MYGVESDETLKTAQDVVNDCVTAAVLLKNWLRELPDSIVPQVDHFLQYFVFVCLTFSPRVFTVNALSWSQIL
jgi:hypothetical protein